MGYTYEMPLPDPNDKQWRTADGVLIKDGLRVWDYNRDLGSVDFGKSFGSDGVLVIDGVSTWDGWFKIRLDKGGHSLMNGERIATYTPFDGAAPPAGK